MGDWGIGGLGDQGIWGLGDWGHFQPFLTNFDGFKLFLTLLTVFDCISYKYERVDCWPYAAFL